MPLINVSKETADSIYWALRMARNAPTNDAIHIEVYDKALREFEASRRAALSREHAQPGQVWTPLEDGVYGKYDTVTVSDNGSMLAISSAYGDGQKRSAMIPLDDDSRLCRLTPPAQEGAGAVEVPDSPGWWAWQEGPLPHQKGVSAIHEGFNKELIVDEEPGGLTSSYFSGRTWWKLTMPWERQRPSAAQSNE